MPRHYGVKPTSNASLSLIGNHFAQPRRVPKWIMPAEQPTDIHPAEKKGVACRRRVRALQVVMA
eukprot:280005-Amphidinium_carterae.1